jgi:hypothetical protein
MRLEMIFKMWRDGTGADCACAGRIDGQVCNGMAQVCGAGKGFAGICLSVLLLAGCAGESRITDGPVNLRPTEPAKVGSGRYHYQFELQDSWGEPEPNKPFAISTQGDGFPGLPFVQDAKKVFQGVTDEQGRTPVIALPFKVPAGHWRLRERFGAGHFGEDFRVTTPGGKPMPSTPYLLIVCENPPRSYFGITGGQGQTAYVASAQPENVVLDLEDLIGVPSRPDDADVAALASHKCASNTP